MLEDLNSTTNLVKVILERNPSTRNSDELLYIAVVAWRNDKLTDQPFCRVMGNTKRLGLPSYETVSRCRRKLQAKYPELRADGDIEAMRMLREAEFREYARE